MLYLIETKTDFHQVLIPLAEFSSIPHSVSMYQAFLS